MGKFTYKASVVHTFHHIEEFEVTVEAESDDEARSEAREAAYDKSNRSSFESEHEETYVDDLDLLHNEPGEGEEEITVRCDKTEDMFPPPKGRVKTLHKAPKNTSIF